MNALRGHSNIQGLTDLGLMSNLLPGYMTLPMQAEQDFDGYIKRVQLPLRPNQLSYWKNYKAFHVSFMKYGGAMRRPPRTTGVMTTCRSWTSSTTCCR